MTRVTLYNRQMEPLAEVEICINETTGRPPESIEWNGLRFHLNTEGFYVG